MIFNVFSQEGKFNKDFKKGYEVSVVELNTILDAIPNNDNNIKLLLKRCWQYKSNINFLRYFRDENERKKVKELSKKILAISNSWLDIISKPNPPYDGTHHHFLSIFQNLSLIIKQKPNQEKYSIRIF